MELNEALEKAAQILDEEQARPTVKYRSTAPSTLLASLAQTMLLTERDHRPRNVCEDPESWALESVNFNLLRAIFSQIADGDRPAFISGLLQSVREPVDASISQSAIFPAFRGQTSALALLAEFCVRTSYLAELLTAAAEPDLPTASLAIMLKQIEEMIALNFNVLPDADLASVPVGLAHLREIAERQTWVSRRLLSASGAPQTNPHYRGGYDEAGKEIVAAIDGITEECRLARYWYLKGALQEKPNLEIESDKLKVESFLTNLGFAAKMVQSLNAAEQDYKATSSPFELKNCLDHLRSFLEHLHIEAAKGIANASHESVIETWAGTTSYLRNKGIFSKQHETFAASLYALLSDTSVHALTAEREYARLLRNVVIEYGVMFLTALDRKGIKI